MSPADARLGFAGDAMLGRLVDEHQRTRPPAAVWGDLLDRLRSLDAVFPNLECCLSTRGTPWTETPHPYRFRADPDWAVPALQAANVRWVNLANNHVLDYHEPALRDTLDALDDAGVARSGAGRDLAEAWRPTAVTVGDLTVGFVSLTDNTPEFAAGPADPGTAYAEIDVEDAETRERVRDALAGVDDADLLVASLHWGPNWNERPPEEFRAFARWLADLGVDLVHGHSPHVFQGVEVRDGALVLYSAGDFVDDYAVDDDLRNDRSFLFEVAVADGEVERLRLVPTEIRDYAVHRASERAASWARERVRDLSAEFGTTLREDDGHLVAEV